MATFKPKLTLAWNAEALANCFTDPTCRAELMRLAQTYEQMAVAAE